MSRQMDLPDEELENDALQMRHLAIVAKRAMAGETAILIVKRGDDLFLTTLTEDGKPGPVVALLAGAMVRVITREGLNADDVLPLLDNAFRKED